MHEGKRPLAINVSPTEKTSPRFCEYMRRGTHGQLCYDYNTAHGDWLGFGSPLLWNGLQAAQRCGLNWYYGDHGYFGRNHYFRITKNAYQHRGLRGAYCMDRLHAVAPKIKPWRISGHHVLVCLQNDCHYARFGFGAGEWLTMIKKKLATATDRPVVVRAHNDTHPLEYHLKNAWACVVYTSNAAVEAAMAGIPVFATGDCAASGIGLADPILIENPVLPDNRDIWAARLAYNQFTFEEMANGRAWRTINESF